LAALQVKVASKLTTGFNQYKTQKALVEAFLGNHQQVQHIMFAWELMSRHGGWKL